jgi:tetratricopeptide (TPR) repeat protein
MRPFVAILLLLLFTTAVPGAAPPASRRNLTAREQKEVAALRARLDRHFAVGEFAQAARLAEQIAAFRSRRQGAGHWQAIDARLAVARWRRRARVPEEQRRAVVRALVLLGEGASLVEKGRYREAEKPLRDALGILGKALGEQHPDTASSYSEAAFCLHHQGKYGEALPLFRKALNIYRKALGEQHPSTAQSYNNMAGCLDYQGRHAEALPLYRKALDIRKKVLGERHPETAQSYNNMAFCLQSQGQSVEALALYRKALAIRLEVLGKQHPDTANSYNNVAFCLDAQGRHAEALPLHRRALAIRHKTLGGLHPETANSYNNVAFCLDGLGRHAEALPPHKKALAIRKKALGERHPYTAQSYNNVAGCLYHQGKYGEALTLYRKALAIRRKVLGLHPDTALSYNNVAACLDRQGKHGEALPLHEKALDIRLEMLGEWHADTADSYNNLATCLDHLGRHGEALPLHKKALAIRIKALGVLPQTAQSYNNVASCLNEQGRHAEALPLHRKALAIRKKVLGQDHPDTANSYNNVALCLDNLGKHALALPLHQKALAIRKKTLGEAHPDTAQSYNNVAGCLNEQGRHAEALPLFGKALAIKRKALGEQHPGTANSYNNVAFCLDRQGKYAEALPLFRKALAIRLETLGEQHPDTALSYNNVASCLDYQGKRAEAVRLLQASLPGQEAARFHAASSGFDRAIASAGRQSPHTMLAAGLALLGQPGNAFRHAEHALARGLLDDLAGADPAERDRIATLSAQLHSVQQRLVPLLARPTLSAEEKALRDRLNRRRRSLEAELSGLASSFSARQVLPLPRIQKQIPADAALVLWVDDLGEHLGCVLRREGPPVWVRLRGRGEKGAWTARDKQLTGSLYRILSDPNAGNDSQRRQLSTALRKQRLEPLRPHLGAKAGLPAVKHLLVVPTGWVAAIPLEALTDDYRVSYVPSGSLYARLRRSHRRLEGKSLLALGDPAFTIPRAPAPPEKGVLLSYVHPAGSAARAGLKSGDVLLKFADRPIASVEDLKKALNGVRLPVPVAYWRGGKRARTQIKGGALGVRVDLRRAPEAVRAWREDGSALLRGPNLKALPGTRQEVLALAKRVPGSTVLLGSDASQQRLDELAGAGKLKSFRLLHLATHGTVDWQQPERSRLFLARDKLPDALEQARQKKPVYTGELTVQAIRQSKGWQLDADLVVLSACQTGLGKETGGDGMLGFAHAFLSRGARCVVLSRWRVDDAATALLMLRFYENLLGKKPLGRAAALEEARSWLRKRKRKQAEQLAGALALGKLASTRGTVGPLPGGKGGKVPAGDHPYAHPYYWASFVLIGDPD